MSRTLSLRLWASVAVAAVAAMTLTACGNDSPSGGDSTPIKLGLSTVLSGPNQIFGVPAKNAITLAVRKQNAAGGLLGRQIELVSYDDQLNAQKSQTNVNRLLKDDNVDMLFSPAGSGPALADLGLAQAANKVYLVLLAQADTITYPQGLDKNPNPNVFSTAIPNSVEAQFLANAIPAVYPKIGLIGETTPYGQSGMEQFRAALKTGEIVEQQSYDQGATSQTAQLLKLNRAGAQVIVSVGLPSDQIVTRKNMETLGMKQPLAGTVGLGNASYYDVVGPKLAAGSIFGNPKTYARPGSYTPEAKAFADAYKAAYGNDDAYGKGQDPQPSFGVTATRAYQAAELYFAAVAQAKSLKTEDVRKALESGTVFPTVDGPITFSAQQHYAFQSDDLSLYTLVEGPNNTVKIEERR